ncbi:MAG: EutN/CcmL family microcompartment protein [Firmicutes bacterium]|nr:EutN/CcmL family microcompartment protein [Bacillota bacterium]MBQ1401277.1 EutN/CcmL family microcompartment protein [Bacillota bacterium]MBR2512289.1 EutN/CcmL family microcompartment protein [Bacillota bacterium]MDO4860080.1 EutN/CcmL family microcompartment protein [Bacillota bacterium]
MLTAKLIDNIWATRKSELLNGYKLMLVEVIGGGANEGQRLVAIDTISAGIGDRILVSLGTAARRMIGDDSVPVDAAIVGIIDEDCEF